MTPSILDFVDKMIANNAQAITEHLATDDHYARLSSTAQWEFRDRNEAYIKLKGVRHDLGNLRDWAVDIEAMIAAQPAPTVDLPQAAVEVLTALQATTLTTEIIGDIHLVGRAFFGEGPITPTDDFVPPDTTGS